MPLPRESSSARRRSQTSGVVIAMNQNSPSSRGTSAGAAGPREALTLGELSRVHRRDALVVGEGPELLELLPRAAGRVEDLGGRCVYVGCCHRVAPCARAAPGYSREPLARG